MYLRHTLRPVNLNITARELSQNESWRGGKEKHIQEGKRPVRYSGNVQQRSRQSSRRRRDEVSNYLKN